MEFTVPGRAETEKVSIFKKGECVEEDLKRLVGNEIRVRANGEGLAKLQVVKVYHTLDTEQSCQRLALKVQVEGKVTYTEEVLEDYSAYEDYGPAAKPEGEARRRKKREEPLSEIEWFDARTRRRRDTGQSDKPPAAFTYTVCISHDPSMNLSGMAIVDITLLSGFEVDTEDLDKLKDLSDQYISHYETTQGRVLLYFDEVPVLEDCVQFGARQTVPIGLVQPASATFYDYYEPGRRCTVFYSAPRRSAMVSTLCSGEVCQCAEKPCYKERKSYDTEVSKKTRVDHACYFPTVQYGYTVEVVNVSQVSNFEKYQATVISVLRANSDEGVAPGAIRTFAKRNQCKGELKAGKKYLIMGNDGLTTDTRGHLQYLLDSVSWVEELPDFGSKCDAKRYRRYCDEMKGFLADYQIDGCKQ
ncbi:complement C4-like [Lepisosteus oculatus]|uniref:complement C4-like n=1 Tax=Lepisosteus oculatus TaxID=7918 RepID=UPI0035F52EE7